MDHAHEALGHARAAGDPASEGYARIILMTGLSWSGRCRDALVEADAAVLAARAGHDEAALAEVLLLRADARSQLCDFDEADRDISEALEIARKADFASIEVLALGHRGDHRLFMGDLPGARQAYDRVLEHHRHVGTTDPLVEWSRAYIRLFGDDDGAAAERELERIIDRTSEYMATCFDEFVAERAAYDGSPGLALEHLDIERRACAALIPTNHFLILVDAERARCKVRLGRLEEAREALEAAEALQARSQHERNRVRLALARADVMAADGQLAEALDVLAAASDLPAARSSAMERARLALGKFALLTPGRVDAAEVARYLEETRGHGLAFWERLGRAAAGAQS